MAKRLRPPEETLVVRRPAQLRALRAPVRAQILRCLDRHGPLPIAELAVRLGRSPESLYYHVRELVRAGYLRSEGKRPSGRRHHVVYGLTHESLLIDQTQRSKAFLDALADHYAARLRRAERDMAKSLEGDRRRPPDETRRTGLLQVDVRLSRAGLERFRRKALALLDELEEEAVEAADEGAMIGVTLAFAALEDSE